MSAGATHWVVLGGAFFIFWFLALLIVLPVGADSAHEAGADVAAGHDPGAPERPRIWLKLVVATAAAVSAWTIFYGLAVARILNL